MNGIIVQPLSILSFISLDGTAQIRLGDAAGRATEGRLKAPFWVTKGLFLVRWTG